MQYITDHETPYTWSTIATCFDTGVSSSGSQRTRRIISPALHLNGSFVFADGATVPKRVGIGSYQELCFVICILLSAYVGPYSECCIRKYTVWVTQNMYLTVQWKVVPVNGWSHIWGEGEWTCSFMLSWPRQKMEVSGQLSVPYALPPEKDPPFTRVYTKYQVGQAPESVWAFMRREVSCLYLESNPRIPQLSIP